MAASREDIRLWFDRAKNDGATHMIVVCDTYDWDDYPVLVYPGENVREAYDSHNGRNMQKVMEVYDLSMDREAQLNEYRAFHL